MFQPKSANVSPFAGRREHVKPEAEQAVLGGLMLDNRHWPSVANTLTAADFHRHDHRLIFSAMHALASQGRPFDKVTVADFLEDADTLSEVGGFQYLGILARDTPSPAMTGEYARIVKHASLERQRQAAYASENHDLAATLTAALKALESGADGRPRLLTIKEVLARPTAYDWLVKGWFERHQSGILWADTGVGKSLVAIDLACCITTGTPWHGCRVKQGGVLYIVGEGAGRGISRRFKAWQLANGISIDDAPIIIREVPTRLPSDTAALIADTTAFLASIGWTLELVILDTLSRTLEGDENSQSDFGAYQHALDQIRVTFSCATLFLHHSGHADKDRPRGASSIGCNIDVSMCMHVMADNTIRLRNPKAKDAAKAADMYFRLRLVDLDEIDDDGEPVASVTLTRVDAPAVKPVEKVLNVRDRIALSILQKQGPLLSSVWRAGFYDAIRANEPDIKQPTLQKAWKTAEVALIPLHVTHRGDLVGVPGQTLPGTPEPPGNPENPEISGLADPLPGTPEPPGNPENPEISGLADPRPGNPENPEKFRKFPEISGLAEEPNPENPEPPPIRGVPDSGLGSGPEPPAGSDPLESVRKAFPLTPATPDKPEPAATEKESADPAEAAADLSSRSSEKTDPPPAAPAIPANLPSRSSPPVTATTYWFILKDGSHISRRFAEPVPLTVAAATGRKLHGERFSYAQAQEVRS